MKNRERLTSVERYTNFTRVLPVLLSGLFVLQPVTALTGLASQQRNSRSRKSRPAALTDAQQIQQVMTKLGFGSKPGEAEFVGQMGVSAYIDQQLQPGSIDDADLDKRLSKLPTLNLSLPAIAEIYNPPKPVPSPSPSLSPSPSPGSSPISQPQKTENPGQPAPAQAIAGASMPQGEVVKMSSAAVPQKQNELPQAKPSPTPKPTPPAKNPQQVVIELQRAELLRAVYSNRQLYESVVNFWENHFSIFSQKDSDRLLLTSFDRDTIRPFAMGRFRDLLGATAHSPAMLFYLDNWRSSVARPYPATKTKPAGVDGGLNENYARELMELHTLGVDGGYSQKDVQEVARCFSGWTILKPNEEGVFLYRPGLHDNGEKIVLGHKIPAGGGLADGERVLDILATQPATAHFIATKLARRFISDDPPPSLIDRAAAVFLKTDGSIRETLRSIVTAPEFFSPVTYRAKVRSPFEYVAAAMRALEAESDGDRPVLDAIGRMGQPVFGRITPDGYADRADQWLASGAMVARFNFASALAANRIKGTKIDLGLLLSGVDEAKKDSVAAKFIRLTVFGDVSAGTRTALEKTARSGSAVNQLAPATNPGASVSVGFDANAAAKPPGPPAATYVTELITLLIGSPE